MTVELLKQATKRVVGNKQTAKAIQKGTAKRHCKNLVKPSESMSVQRQPRYSKVDRDLEALLKDFYNH